MLATRPDITYTVRKLAQFNSSLCQRHWQAVVKVLKYLRKYHSVRRCLGNTSPGLTVSPSASLPRESSVRSELKAYFVTSLMDCPTSRKSTGGYIVFLNGACISWASKKQLLVALSSSEAEFIAGADAAEELSRIVHFLQDLGVSATTPMLYGDNHRALALAQTNAYRPPTKHIHARESFIAEIVQNGFCTVSYVPSHDMIADALTKALPRERHSSLTRLIGLHFGTLSSQICKHCRQWFSTNNDLSHHLRKESYYCELISASTPLAQIAIAFHEL